MPVNRLYKDVLRDLGDTICTSSDTVTPALLASIMQVGPRESVYPVLWDLMNVQSEIVRDVMHDGLMTKTYPELQALQDRVTQSKGVPTPRSGATWLLPLLLPLPLPLPQYTASSARARVFHVMNTVGRHGIQYTQQTYNAHLRNDICCKQGHNLTAVLTKGVAEFLQHAELLALEMTSVGLGEFMLNHPNVRRVRSLQLTWGFCQPVRAADKLADIRNYATGTVVSTKQSLHECLRGFPDLRYVSIHYGKPVSHRSLSDMARVLRQWLLTIVDQGSVTLRVMGFDQWDTEVILRNATAPEPFAVRAPAMSVGHLHIEFSKWKLQHMLHGSMRQLTELVIDQFSALKQLYIHQDEPSSRASLPMPWHIENVLIETVGSVSAVASLFNTTVRHHRDVALNAFAMPASCRDHVYCPDADIFQHLEQLSVTLCEVNGPFMHSILWGFRRLRSVSLSIQSPIAERVTQLVEGVLSNNSASLRDIDIHVGRPCPGIRKMFPTCRTQNPVRLLIPFHTGLVRNMSIRSDDACPVDFVPPACSGRVFAQHAHTLRMTCTQARGPPIWSTAGIVATAIAASGPGIISHYYL